jgi:hypothetical protein
MSVLLSFILGVAAIASPQQSTVASAALHSDASCVWQITKSPNPYSDGNVLNGVTSLGTGDAWAVGGMVSGGNPIAEHWDGQRWSLTDIQDEYGTGLSSVYMASSNDVWAVGSYWQGEQPREAVEQWNGSAWTWYPVHDSPEDAWLLGVAGDGPDDIWAVGTVGGGATVAVHFDGTTWTNVPTPNPGTHGNSLYGIEVFSPDDAWATGYSNPGGRWQTLSEHWNGKMWKVVPSPSIGGNDNFVFASASILDERRFWMVGDTYDYANSTYSSQAEYWNGSTWTMVPSPDLGLDTYIYGAAAGGTSNIWAFGQWYDGSTYAPYAMNWNGSTWASQPGIAVGPTGSKFLGGSNIPGTSDKWAVGTQTTSYGTPHLTLIEWLHCS